MSYYNRPSNTNQQIYKTIDDIEAILNNRGSSRTMMNQDYNQYNQNTQYNQ